MKKLRIYTGTGDQGSTGLYGGERVSKADLRVEAYGQLDELSAVLGLAAAAIDEPELGQRLHRIQSDLFDMGADLATPAESRLRERLPQLVEEEDWRRLEGWIDDYDASLPPLRTFVLPGGSEAAARIHYARTVCRTTERMVVRFAAEASVRPENLVYLNRLADLLFVIGRHLNHRAGVEEIPWVPRRDEGDGAEPGDGARE